MLQCISGSLQQPGERLSTRTPRTEQVVWCAAGVTSKASGFGHCWRQKAGFDELVI